MEFLVIGALVIVAVEEIRLWLDRKAAAKLMTKYQRLMQEHDAVENQVAQLRSKRSSYELECQ